MTPPQRPHDAAAPPPRRAAQPLRCRDDAAAAPPPRHRRDPSPLGQTPNQSIQIKLLHDASPAVEVKRYSHLPFLRACAAIARYHGPLSFYDGLGPAVAKGALTNSVRFVGYNLCEISRWGAGRDLPTMSTRPLRGVGATAPRRRCKSHFDIGTTPRRRHRGDDSTRRRRGAA